MGNDIDVEVGPVKYKGSVLVLIGILIGALVTAVGLLILLMLQQPAPVVHLIVDRSVSATLTALPPPTKAPTPTPRPHFEMHYDNGNEETIFEQNSEYRLIPGTRVYIRLNEYYSAREPKWWIEPEDANISLQTVEEGKKAKFQVPDSGNIPKFYIYACEWDFSRGSCTPGSTNIATIRTVTSPQ